MDVAPFNSTYYSSCLFQILLPPHTWEHYARSGHHYRFKTSFHCQILNRQYQTGSDVKWHHCRFLWTDADVEPAVMWFSENKPKNAIKNRKKILMRGEVPPDDHKSCNFSREKCALRGHKRSNPCPLVASSAPKHSTCKLFVSKWNFCPSQFMFICF